MLYYAILHVQSHPDAYILQSIMQAMPVSYSTTLPLSIVYAEIRKTCTSTTVACSKLLACIVVGSDIYECWVLTAAMNLGIWLISIAIPWHYVP